MLSLRGGGFADGETIVNESNGKPKNEVQPSITGSSVPALPPGYNLAADSTIPDTVVQARTVELGSLFWFLFNVEALPPADAAYRRALELSLAQDQEQRAKGKEPESQERKQDEPKGWIN